jgi:hypothetical protein
MKLYVDFFVVGKKILNAVAVFAFNFLILAMSKKKDFFVIAIKLKENKNGLIYLLEMILKKSLCL